MPARLGDITLDYVQGEKVKESAKVSNKKTEDKQTLTDTVVNNPKIFNISGNVQRQCRSYKL